MAASLVSLEQSWNGLGKLSSLTGEWPGSGEAHETQDGGDRHGDYNGDYEGGQIGVRLDPVEDTVDGLDKVAADHWKGSVDLDGRPLQGSDGLAGEVLELLGNGGDGVRHGGAGVRDAALDSGEGVAEETHGWFRERFDGAVEVDVRV